MEFGIESFTVSLLYSFANLYQYEEKNAEDNVDEACYGGSSSFCIGNRRWGDNSYVMAGPQKARPVHRSNFQDSAASSSREPKKKEVVRKSTTREGQKRQIEGKLLIGLLRKNIAASLSGHHFLPMLLCFAPTALSAASLIESALPFSYSTLRNNFFLLSLPRWTCS